MKEEKNKTKTTYKKRKHNVLTENSELTPNRKHDAMHCQPHPKGSGKKSTLFESHPYFLMLARIIASS